MHLICFVSRGLRLPCGIPSRPHDGDGILCTRGIRQERQPLNKSTYHLETCVKHETRILTGRRSVDGVGQQRYAAKQGVGRNAVTNILQKGDH